MSQGNIDCLMANRSKIIRCLRNLKTSLTGIAAEYHCAYPTVRKFVLANISLSEWEKIRRKILSKGGVKTRFQKAIVPWNKGLHYDPGGRSIETRFKPGQMRGNAARRYKPCGTITVRKDNLPRQKRSRKRKEGMPPWPRNYRRYIKIKDTGPSNYCWITYARYLWGKANGPVPESCFIVHVDGNTMNDNLYNLRCVDRKGHLALQLERDPTIRQKMVAHSIRTRRKNRKHKKTACMHKPKNNVFWQCKGCGQNYYQEDPPPHCSKCTGGGFERIVHKISA